MKTPDYIDHLREIRKHSLLFSYAEAKINKIWLPDLVTSAYVQLTGKSKVVNGIIQDAHPVTGKALLGIKNMHPEITKQEILDSLKSLYDPEELGERSVY